jgi:hypothetical protein
MGLPRTFKVRLEIEIWLNRIRDHSKVKHTTPTTITGEANPLGSNDRTLDKAIPSSGCQLLRLHVPIPHNYIGDPEGINKISKLGNLSLLILVSFMPTPASR